MDIVKFSDELLELFHKNNLAPPARIEFSTISDYERFVIGVRRTIQRMSSVMHVTEKNTCSVDGVVYDVARRSYAGPGLQD